MLSPEEVRDQFRSIGKLSVCLSAGYLERRMRSKSLLPAGYLEQNHEAIARRQADCRRRSRRACDYDTAVGLSLAGSLTPLPASQHSLFVRCPKGRIVPSSRTKRRASDCHVPPPRVAHSWVAQRSSDAGRSPQRLPLKYDVKSMPYRS